jgi:hypothetical protein
MAGSATPESKFVNIVTHGRGDWYDNCHISTCLAAGQTGLGKTKTRWGAGFWWVTRGLAGGAATLQTPWLALESTPDHILRAG